MRSRQCALFLWMIGLAGVVTAQEAKPMKFLMLGDSHIARGMPQAVEGPLNALMGGKVVWTLINGGVGGDDARACTERLPKLLLTEKPDVVLISFGGNDQWKKHTPERYRDNLLRGLGVVKGYAAKNNVPAPAIFFMTCPLVDRTRHFSGKDASLNAQGGIDFVLDMHYYGTMRELAAEKNVPLIDLHRFLMDKDLNETTLKDGVHLSEKGYKMAGPYVAQVIAAWYLAEIAKDEKAVKARDATAAKLKELMPAATEAGDPALRKELLAKLDEIWKQCPYLPAQAAAWQAVYFADAPVPQPVPPPPSPAPASAPSPSKKPAQ